MFEIIENQLSYQTYSSLRQKVNFQKYEKDDIIIALSNSLYTVEIKKEERTIGIGRIVGDNKIVFFIKDVVVDPEFQKHGIGDLIMKQILTFVNKHCCDNAYVGLMATPNTEGFYEKFGFLKRPNSIMGSGMVLYIKK